MQSTSATVKDEDGNGIAGVIITYEGEVSGATETSANGTFTISGLIGPTTISANKEGWNFSEPITVDKASDVITFIGNKKLYPLTVSYRGFGTVTETVLVTAQGDYEYGTVVQLLAIPDESWYFSHWEGALSGKTNPTVITVKEETEVIAVFTGPASIMWKCFGEASIPPINNRQSYHIKHAANGRIGRGGNKHPARIGQNYHQLLPGYD